MSDNTEDESPFWVSGKISYSIYTPKNKCFGSTTKINSTVCINLFWVMTITCNWVRGISLLIGSINIKLVTHKH